MIHSSSVLKFSRKLPKARGLSAKDTLSSSLGHRSTCVELPGDPDATSCFLATRRIPWRPPSDATPPPPPFLPIPWPPSIFPVGLSLSSSRESYSSPWPPTSAGVLCFPQPRRRAEKVRLDVLLLLAKGIDPRCLESPPPSRIPRWKRAPLPPKFVVSGHPPAKPTPPAGSRRAPSPAAPFPLLLPRRSRRHGRPLEVPGSRSAWAIAQPTRPGWLAYVAAGPFSQPPWVKLTPVQKVPCSLFQF
jgi:hypothetical protein